MFEGSRLKVARANQHIAALEKTFRLYTDRCPCRISKESEPNTKLLVSLILDEPLPNEIPLTIGDAIHNLRTSLDHATWELIGIDGGTQDKYTKLPIGRGGRKAYEAHCRGLKTPKQETKDFFIQLAIHNESGSPLFTLNDLDNTDKHMVMVPTVAGGKTPTFRVLDQGGNTGVHIAGLNVGVGPSRVTRIGSFGQGLRIETDQNSEVTPDLFFSDAHPLPGAPVIPTLKKLSAVVSQTIDAFTALVSNRSN